MRILIAFLAMLLCTPLLASPGQVDSTISGVYLAPGRVCNLVVSRPPSLWDGVPRTWWVRFDLQCMTFAGQFRRTLTSLYVYTDCPSFGAGAVVPDYSALPYEFTSIRSAGVQSLDVIRSNDPTAAANGIGQVETWLKVQPLASPFPYSCANGRKG